MTERTVITDADGRKTTVETEKTKGLGCLGWLALAVAVAVPLQWPLWARIPAWLLVALLVVGYLSRQRG